MHIESLMTRDVKTCTADDSLDVAARAMWENDCGCVPVVDADGGVIGMLTDRDICMAAYTQGAALSALQVGPSMATTVYSCKPKDSPATAENLMRTHRIRRLPVIGANGRLVGILSLNDLAREAGRVHSGKSKAAVQARDVSDTLAAICTPRAQDAAAQVA